MKKDEIQLTIETIRYLQQFFYNFTQEDIEWLKLFMHGHLYNKLLEKNAHYTKGQVIRSGAWWDMLADISDDNSFKVELILRVHKRYGK